MEIEEHETATIRLRRTGHIWESWARASASDRWTYCCAWWTRAEAEGTAATVALCQTSYATRGASRKELQGV